uniref:Lymphoid-restricted membrane protein n=1 Tax=Sparus aurata TaxID=8175 RepID=A0A671YDH4_SPAAU
MDYYTPQPNRRHNPVESICRKLQTIQWRGDREPNSPFQIPKLSSGSYDSTQCGLRHNLEAILKKGGKGMGMPSSAVSQGSLGSSVPMSIPSTPTMPANVTYTVTSTLGERRGADGSDLRQVKKWQRYCSTPTGQSKESPYFTFTRGPQTVQPESEKPSRSPPLSHTFTPNHSTVSYNLNFCSGDTGNLIECELPYPALVVKRLSMGDGGSSLASENRKENMAEISLICEENLLDTIFHACDTQRRGKVFVSHIVDYLRHTTSRTSEDSGLEELCNMLDPEHKDVSIDLDTYHAVMREWIDDCRNNGDEPTDDVTQDSVKLRDSLSAKRSMLLNMTSGSLEAFGGEASRAEFETSELVYCVADLQMSNQKLQEEVRKLKQVVEGMEDGNQKLAEENEELRNQARINHQLAQKEKILKEEVEEMKATLSCTEEGRARASAHSKHDVTTCPNSPLMAPQNFKVTMETDELQRRIAELCDINADLQVPLLRADKSKLENQIQMMHPDLASAGLSLSVAYRLNQSSSGSLQTELALAQSPLEALNGLDHFSTTMSFASPLDETLDREVLLMLQGPSPEHMAKEFKSLLNKLKRDFTEETASVLSSVRGLLDDHAQPGGNTGANLQTVQADLDSKRADWALSLDQLAQYTDSLEKELIKMASNMRRSRTEILHLSVRVQEQENQKRQLCEELEQLKTPQDSREASSQTPAPEEEVREEGQAESWKSCEKGGSKESNMDLEGNVRMEGSELGEREGEKEQREAVIFVRVLQELSSCMEAIEEHKDKEDQSETSKATERECTCHIFNVHNRYIFTTLSFPCFQTEFQRLALGFKCDMFTLEKRLRLEERSRDLAEENVRREVSSCQGLLQALIPLCEDDNQSMEIIQRLQKNLDILIQSMTRVSSRSEMLGAIHQESRIGKAVEVMIQHVENLRRMYTKEHAELLELRETLMQNERSFGSQTERGMTCKLQCFFFSRTRVNEMFWQWQRNSRDPVGIKMKNVYIFSSTARPPLKRFVSSAAWVDTEEPSLVMKGVAFPNTGKMCCFSAGLLALLASLVMQPVVDAAPVGTGDSWMTIQQLLWPYAGLRHNGQPPV